jgi:hypothetical protein
MSIGRGGAWKCARAHFSKKIRLPNGASEAFTLCSLETVAGGRFELATFGFCEIEGHTLSPFNSVALIAMRPPKEMKKAEFWTLVGPSKTKPGLEGLTPSCFEFGS